jgi:hypothetical protein
MSENISIIFPSLISEDKVLANRKKSVDKGEFRKKSEFEMSTILKVGLLGSFLQFTI